MNSERVSFLHGTEKVDGWNAKKHSFLSALSPMVGISTGGHLEIPGLGLVMAGVVATKGAEAQAHDWADLLAVRAWASPGNKTNFVFTGPPGHPAVSVVERLFSSDFLDLTPTGFDPDYPEPLDHYGDGSQSVFFPRNDWVPEQRIALGMSSELAPWVKGIPAEIDWTAISDHRGVAPVFRAGLEVHSVPGIGMESTALAEFPGGLEFLIETKQSVADELYAGAILQTPSMALWGQERKGLCASPVLVPLRRPEPRFLRFLGDRLKEESPALADAAIGCLTGRPQ